MRRPASLTLVIALALAVPLGAVRGGEPPPWAPDAVPTDPDMARLVAAAQHEGALNVIALPRDWCNYGAVIDSFATKYGIEVNENDPGDSSADAIQAIIDHRGSDGPEAPDVVDVGPPFAELAREQGLLRPYRVRTWRTIPAAAREIAGHWYAGYYGLLAFEVNADLVSDPPSDWTDLLAEAYDQPVALGGDPRVAQQALQAVYVAAQVNGGSLDDAAPGLDFWEQVFDAGNLLPTVASPDMIDDGTTPIAIRWTFNAMAHRDAADGERDIGVIVPPSARVAGMYAQAISSFAPHPNAARLWLEYLYSDEGQRTFAEGYCHPMRLPDLIERGAIPQDVLDLLPDAAGAVFPTVSQSNAAADVIINGWGSVIGE